MGEIFDIFQGLANGFQIAFSLTNITFALIGAILGTMEVEQVYKDREAFAQRVQEVSETENPAEPAWQGSGGA